MAKRLTNLLPRLSRLTTAHAADADLLARFARGRDEAAFTALVIRHGPMVFRVCRRVLGEVQAAEDAAQAAFLVLARKAVALGQPARLAGWLHGVAYRVALKARATLRQGGCAPGLTGAPDPLDPRPDPLSELTARELFVVVEEEVHRLPEAYRGPVVLCCLEGLSLEEAAQRSGVTLGSLRGPLERGRKRLGERLAKRGLTLSAALAAVAAARGTAATPSLFAATTARAALSFVADRDTAVGMAAALAEQVLPTVAASKANLAAALLLAFGAVALGAALLAPSPLAQDGNRRPEAIGADLQPPQAGGQERVDRAGDPLPAGAITRLGTLRFRHGASVYSVAVSPDGKLAASAGGGIGCVWELATGKLVQRFADADDYARCTFSADGKVLLVARLGQVDLWGVRGRRRVAGFREPGVGRTVAALSPDGKTIALTYAEAPQGEQITRVKLRDVASGKELTTFGDSSIGIGQVAFTPDGKTVVTTSWHFARPNVVNVAWAKRWDAASGRLLRELAIREVELVSLTVAPDGRTVIVCPNVLAADPNAPDPQLWDSVTGKQLPVRIHARRTLLLSLTPDGKKMAASGDKGLRIWDTTTGRELCRMDLSAHKYQTTMALTPDGKTLVSAGMRGQLRRWDAATGKEIEPSDTPAGDFYALALSPDGKLLATAGESEIVHLWETRTGKEVRRLRLADSGLMGLTFTPDGKTLIGDGNQFWDVATGRAGGNLQRPPAPGEPRPLHATLSPDGRTLACALGAEIILYDVARRKERRRFGKEARAWGPLAFSPDGKTLASGQTLRIVPTPTARQAAAPQPGGGEGADADATLLLWEVAPGRLRARAPATGNLQALTFAPDGKVVFGVVAYTLVAWEAKTGRPANLPHAIHAQAVVPLPDGVLAVASGEQVKLYDAATYQVLATLGGHRGIVQRLARSADGRVLASAGSDGTVLLWDVAQVPRARKGK